MLNSISKRTRSLQTYGVLTGLLLLLALAACGGGGGSSPGPNLPVTFSITARPQTINAGSSYTFTSSVANATNKSVSWKVACAQGVTDCGSIDANTGVYSAPMVSATTDVTVTATSVADGSKTDSFTFRLIPLTPTVSITTRPSTINAGLSYKFLATVIGRADTSVTWTLTCQPEAQCGAIAADGTYTTPANVTQQSSFTVTATSVAANASDSITMILLPPIAVAILPGSVEVSQGFSYPFSVSVKNDMAYVGVTWSVNGIPGGNSEVGTIAPLIDPFQPSRATGLYTSPAQLPATAITVTAISKVDTNKSADAVVTLIPNPHPDFKGDCAFLIGDAGGASDAAGGMLTLDGSGHLTAKADIHRGSYTDEIYPRIDMTGTYGFEGRHGGWANLTYSQSGQSASMTFKFVMVSDTVAKVIEFDGMGGDVGSIEKQSPNFGTALDGKHVVSLKGYKVNANPSLSETYALLGQFTGNTGSLNGKWEMVDSSPQHVDHDLSGSYAYGVAGNTVSLAFENWTSNPSSDFFLYPVSADRALIMSKASPILVGTIDRQSNVAFSNSTLAGDWVFYASNVGTYPGATLGRFSSDGTGTNAPGCTDWTGGGSSISPMCYSIDLNAYTIDSNGRGFAPSAQFAQPFPVVFYFIDSNHGYFGTQTKLGEFFRREGAPFSNAPLSGDYAVIFTGSQDYFWNGKTHNQVGTATLDGLGNINMVTSWVDGRNYALLQGYKRTGTYAFDMGLYGAGEGRGVMSLGEDFQLLYYAVSPDKVLMIQIDYDDVSFGIMQRVASSVPPPPQ